VNTDKLTTLTGILLGALIAASIDYGKMLGGDTAEIGKAIGAVVIAAHGWLTNKPR